MTNWKFRNITIQVDFNFWCIGVHWAEVVRKTYRYDKVFFITLIPCISIRINFEER